MTIDPRLRLLFAITIISLYPIAFFAYAQRVHTLFGVFLIYCIVTLFCFYPTYKNLKPAKNSSVIRSLREKISGKAMFIIVLSSLITILGNFLVIYAMSFDYSPTMVQSILRTENVFVTLGGILIFKEQYSKALPLVLIMIVVGFGVLSQDAMTNNFDFRNLYFLQIVLAALCFGSFQILSKLIIHEVNIYVINGIRSILGALIMLPFVYPYFYQLSWEVVGFAILAAILGPFLGRILILSTTRDLPLNVIGCNMAITPILTLSFQWLLFRTMPSQNEMVGGGIIILAVLLFNLFGFVKKRRTKKNIKERN